MNLTIEIVDVTRGQKATFVAVAAGQGLPGAAVGPLGGSLTPSAVLTKGTPTPFTTSKATDLSGFAGRIAIFVDPGAAASVFSTDSFFRISFEGLEANRSVFTKPSSVALSAGTRFDTAPQFGLGAVTHGTLVQRK